MRGVLWAAVVLWGAAVGSAEVSPCLESLIHLEDRLRLLRGHIADQLHQIEQWMPPHPSEAPSTTRRPYDWPYNTRRSSTPRRYTTQRPYYERVPIVSSTSYSHRGTSRPYGKYTTHRSYSYGSTRQAPRSYSYLTTPEPERNYPESITSSVVGPYHPYPSRTSSSSHGYPYTRPSSGSRSTYEGSGSGALGADDEDYFEGSGDGADVSYSGLRRTTGSSSPYRLTTPRRLAATTAAPGLLETISALFTSTEAQPRPELTFVEYDIDYFNGTNGYDIVYLNGTSWYDFDYLNGTSWYDIDYFNRTRYFNSDFGNGTNEYDSGSVNETSEYKLDEASYVEGPEYYELDDIKLSDDDWENSVVALED